MLRVTPFGPPWDQLTLDDLSAFLRDAPSEPLSWEAKGEMNAASIRKQVCGFANGHDVGYLIVGAQERDGRWVLDGTTFSGHDPPNAVTNLIANGGVTPYPDGLDVRPFEVGDGKQVAAVRIPPVAVPPCNTLGTVYERVSGKTIPVVEPMRLAELFSRGDGARQRAAAAAATAAQAVLLSGRVHPPQNVQCALGLAAAGYAADVRTRLFRPGFDAGILSGIERALVDDPLVPPGGPEIMREVSQESLVLQTTAVHSLGDSWIVRASWEGGVGVHWSMDVQATVVESMVDQKVRRAWAAAEDIIEQFKPIGPRYLHVIPAGGSFRMNAIGSVSDRTSVARGPLEPGVSSSVLASIKRELERATGRMAYERDE